MTTPPDCPPLPSPPWGAFIAPALVAIAVLLTLFGCAAPPAAPAPRPLAPPVVAPTRPAPAFEPRAGAMKCGGGRCDPVLDPAGFAHDPECAWEREHYVRPSRP